MVGVKIPVIEIEKLSLKEDGRGFYYPNDDGVASGETWTGKWAASGGGFTSSQVLPAASATAWFKVTIGSTSYYLAGFNTHW